MTCHEVDHYPDEVLAEPPQMVDGKRTSLLGTCKACGKEVVLVNITHDAVELTDVVYEMQHRHNSKPECD